MMTNKQKIQHKVVEQIFIEEIRKYACTLLLFQAYLHVRDRFNNCLRHVTTLAKWYSVIDAKPGFTQEVLGMLKAKVQMNNKKFFVH